MNNQSTFHKRFQVNIRHWTVVPLIHMLKSPPLGPHNVTVFGDGALKEVMELK